MPVAKNGILVVGAGFSGAVFARTLAEAGYTVDVIDKRDHIAGNAYDFVDENGIRVHRYGPHLFHTSNERVVEWLSAFGAWTPYMHRVRAVLEDGRFVPLPVNLTTINAIFGESLRNEEETVAFLARIAEPIAKPRNAGEYLNSRIGRTLTDLFFRPYTKKMWTLDLEDMDDSVVRRIPLRYDEDDRYFPNDRFQMMPRDGYTAVFKSIFDHPGIRVSLGVNYARGMEAEYRHCFNGMPIDAYFDYELGELPYRSIRFHARSEAIREDRKWSVTNFVDTGKYTRETWWHVIPGHLERETGLRTLTLEEPCDYKDNDLERYYPVKTADGRYQRIYKDYKALGDRLPNMTFIGRCGTYQYLDMDQVINQSLTTAEKWLMQAAA
jgi:UDP-galactopyranose mutase